MDKRTILLWILWIVIMALTIGLIIPFFFGYDVGFTEPNTTTTKPIEAGCYKFKGGCFCIDKDGESWPCPE